MTIDTRLDIENEPETPPTQGTAKNGRLVVMGLAALLVACAAGGAYYVHSRPYESTDDAFLEGSVVGVSPRVPGQVIRVLIGDNQHVNRGDLLAEIDPAGYQARADGARARLADLAAKASGAESNLALAATVTGATLVQADAAASAAGDQIHILEAHIEEEAAAVRAAQAGIEQAQAQQEQAQAEADRAAKDVVRYQALYAKDEVSRQQLDQSEMQARATHAALGAARMATEAAKARLAQATASKLSTEAGFRQAHNQLLQAQGKVSEAKSGPDQVRARHADVSSLRAQMEQNQAALQEAELELSYTRVYAPESGFVTRKAVEAGDFVQTGQSLLALVPDRVWVTANFKETQLRNMRPGQPATVKIDAYPQLRLRGHVDSIQSGSGARFSLLPAENATGNYVKVVQRVPVKIVLNENPPAGYRLGPGMSVEPEVKVR
jgi:membrane fusion protein (multidrug efflux system)